MGKYVNRIIASIIIFATGIINYNSANCQEIALKNEKSPLSPFYDCKLIKNNNERLVCFDNAVDIFAKKEAASDIKIIDKSQLEQMQKSAFGLSTPINPFLDKNINPQNEKAAVIINNIINENGITQIITSDNQIWQLTENEELIVLNKPPIKATISAAALGSFGLTIDGKKRFYRVKRIK
jgi:hypothetical protein